MHTFTLCMDTKYATLVYACTHAFAHTHTHTYLCRHTHLCAHTHTCTHISSQYGLWEEAWREWQARSQAKALPAESPTAGSTATGNPLQLNGPEASSGLQEESSAVMASPASTSLNLAKMAKPWEKEDDETSTRASEHASGEGGAGRVRIPTGLHA